MNARTTLLAALPCALLAIPQDPPAQDPPLELPAELDPKTIEVLKAYLEELENEQPEIRRTPESVHTQLDENTPRSPVRASATASGIRAPTVPGSCRARTRSR